MFGFLRRFLRFPLFHKEEFNPGDPVVEKWTADFSKPKKVRFDIKSETSYDANLHREGLALGLKKTNCIAWVEAPLYRYGDQIIEGRIVLNPHGGYGAAGFMFRMVDDQTYYSVLVSCKGYFRLDVLRNGSPLALIGWTEVPSEVELSKEVESSLEQSDHTLPPGTLRFAVRIIAYGSHLILLLNGRWAAEIDDPTIAAGRLCFALASYESSGGVAGTAYTAEALLEALSVDSRITEVEANYTQWSVDPPVDPQSHLHLAETFAAMGQAAPALIQLKKGWERRGREKRAEELLLAGRLALQLGLLDEAAEYINGCIAAGGQGDEGREGMVEKAKLLYLTESYPELIAYGIEAVDRFPDNPTLWTLLGHGYWNQQDYPQAAAAYDRAFELDPKNGITAKNAANMYELLDMKDEALRRYLSGGRAFLGEDNYGDLGSCIPKLLGLGADNWEAHGLAGKWAFSIEDWAMAEREFRAAETLRQAMDPLPAQDPALVFLRGLLLIREGKRREALPLLEEAVDLEGNYALFRFKLAETRFLLTADPWDPKLNADIEAALSLASEDEAPTANNPAVNDQSVGGGTGGLSGWIANLAAQIALARGDLDAAGRHLERAARSLGDVPAIRVNRGQHYYLQGSMDKALEILTVDKAADPEGVMANCAGNLLVRSGRFDDADGYYRKALSIAPDNPEYLCNRASCLIELNLFGEADELLARAHELAPSPAALELIAYVAVKKGEYPRAEAACSAALEMDGRHVPSLLSLGWIYLSSRRWDELKDIIRRLDELELDDDSCSRREDLRTRLDESLTQVISCASCDRTWRIPKSPPPAPPIRLFAMPPDDLPAGTCPECGDTYCIGCGKALLDKGGRFRCPKCSKPLKLIHEGLKQLVYDWAGTSLPKD